MIQCAKARAKGFWTVENMITIVFLMTGCLEHLPHSPYKNIGVFAKSVGLRFKETAGWKRTKPL